MINRRYTIGSDPELFIVNNKTNKVVSAIDKIPGHKEEPYREGLPEGFGLQTDNILAEFNVPPVTNESDFIANIEFMKSYIDNKVKEINPNFGILCQASARVPAKELKHPQAREFGCSPDYCIYTKGPNAVTEASNTTLRSSGFHLHVGYENNNIDTSLVMLAYVDAFVGVPSILYDTDTERRSLYGKAGCFRLTNFGFEYRTLSSYWIGTKSRLQFIYRQLIYALEAFERGYSLPDPAEVRNTINSNDIENAKRLIDEYTLIYPENVDPE